MLSEVYPRATTVSSEIINNKSMEFSKAMDRMARRSFHINSRSLNRVSQYSLGKTQIKDISQRAFSAISRQKPHPATSILNIIKGKPHRIRLGQTSGATTGFNEIANDFYTNIYSDRIPSAIKLTFDPPKRPSKQKYGQNSKVKLISNIRKTSKLMNLSQKMNKHMQQSKYIQKLDTIIFGCNNLLNPSDKRLGQNKVPISRYH